MLMGENNGVRHVDSFTFYLLSILSLRRIQGCNKLSECIHANSHCSTLCEGGEWLDLSDIEAKVYFKHTRKQKYPHRAIDESNTTCSVPVRSHLVFANCRAQV